MIVTYAPSEGERREWEYKSADLPSGEAEDIEDAVGITFEEWQASLLQGGAKARRALLWVLLKREQPGLKFGDVSFRLGELGVDFDRDEQDQLLVEMNKNPNVSEEQAAAVRRVLGRDGEEAASADGAAGKGRSTRGSPTGTSG